MVRGQGGFMVNNLQAQRRHYPEERHLPSYWRPACQRLEDLDLYEVLRKIEARQAPTRAILARQIMGRVFDLAIMTHRAEYNVVEPLKGKIARRVVEHRKHLKDNDLPDFLRKLHDYSGHQTTAIAMKLLLLCRRFALVNCAGRLGMNSRSTGQNGSFPKSA